VTSMILEFGSYNPFIIVFSRCWMVAQGQRLQKTDLSVKVSRIRGAVKSVAITWHVGINVLWQRHEISKLRFSTLELVSTSLGLHPFGILLVCQKLFLLGFGTSGP